MNTTSLIGNGMDIFILVCVLICLVLGWQRGLLKTLIGFLSFFAGIIVAVIFSGKITAVLNEKYGLSEMLRPFFEKHVHLPDALIARDVSTMELENLNDQLNGLDLPAFIRDLLLKAIDASKEVGASLTSAVGSSVADLFVTMLVFIGVTIIVMFLIRIIFNKILFQVFPGLIGLLDHIGGAAMGMLNAAVLIVILTLVLVPLKDMTSFFGIDSSLLQQLKSLTEGSGILSWTNDFLQTFRLR